MIHMHNQYDLMYIIAALTRMGRQKKRKVRPGTGIYFHMWNGLIFNKPTIHVAMHFSMQRSFINID